MRFAQTLDLEVCVPAELVLSHLLEPLTVHEVAALGLLCQVVVTAAIDGSDRSILRDLLGLAFMCNPVHRFFGFSSCYVLGHS